jgi:predicted  nucleic acid-binding Zn-ribbon protein
MSSSPFRDEMQALRSALSELQNENSELRAALSRQQEELEAMRARAPENIGAVMRPLQEENAELRARVGELEPQLAQYAYERRVHRNTDPLTGVGDAISRMLDGFFGRK